MEIHEITGRTGLICLLGSPVAHSISPAMHNEAFRQLGLDYVYLAFDVDESGLETAVSGLRQMGARGWNLTMPDKSRMARLCDELTPAAKFVGAVNTVVNEDGVLKGFTTDGTGYMRAAQDAGCALPGRVMTLLGGGGAAAAICAQAALDGMKEIRVFNRSGKSRKRMDALAQALSDGTSCRVSSQDLADRDSLAKSLGTSDILTNATSAGMAPHEDECALPDFGLLDGHLAVSDIIYNPRKTVLLREAEKRGCRTFNGLFMLLYQGAAAFELWTGRKMPVNIIKAKYFAE